MNFSKNIQRESAGFQMAPMIDVVFLLLIFYMVLSVQAQWETKMGLEIPTAATGEQATRTPVEIIINVDKDGNVFVNDTKMSLDRLEQLLKQVAAFEGNPVIIRADKNTNFENVIQILDRCRKVDIWNVSFATMPDKEAK